MPVFTEHGVCDRGQIFAHKMYTQIQAVTLSLMNSLRHTPEVIHRIDTFRAGQPTRDKMPSF